LFRCQPQRPMKPLVTTCTCLDLDLCYTQVLSLCYGKSTYRRDRIVVIVTR
jgi:hypothetical protein